MAKGQSIEQLVGQCLIVGFEGTEMSSGLQTLLARMQPAGVILFARNITSAEQTYHFLQDCRASVSTPLFTCVDMEGGRVDRLKNAIAPAPAAADVFATGDPRMFRKHGSVIGNSCRMLGCNTDLAPVLDLAFEASTKVMGSRAASADPAKVVRYAREFLAGLRSAGVLGCGKHFPGLGEANLDTHHELPEIKKSFEKMWEQDMRPYRAMRRELPMVLVGHASYPTVTKGGTPASLSKKWITDILRKKIAYRGLVLSDDLEMGGVLQAASIGQAAVEHIRAGGDLALICHLEENVTQAYEAMLKEAARNRKFRDRIAESARRVLRFKKACTELRRRIPAPSRPKLERLSRRLWEFSEQVRLEALQREEIA